MMKFSYLKISSLIIIHFLSLVSHITLFFQYQIKKTVWSIVQNTSLTVDSYANWSILFMYFHQFVAITSKVMTIVSSNSTS